MLLRAGFNLRQAIKRIAPDITASRYLTLTKPLHTHLSFTLSLPINKSFSSLRPYDSAKMAMMTGSEFNIEAPKADEQPSGGGVGGAVPAAETPSGPQSDTELVPGQKRPAEDDLQGDGNQKRTRADDNPSEETPGASEVGERDNSNGSPLPTTDADGKPLSKNQLKRLKRQQRWEDKKEDRKVKRKDKRHAQQARKREELQDKIAKAKEAGIDPQDVIRANLSKPPKRPDNPVPVAFILDCEFEKYMRDGENVSLSSQVVRSYAMVRMAKYQPHLFVSGYGGKLKERFETVLRNNHKGWKNAVLTSGDFVQAAKMAEGVMKGPGAGKVDGALEAVDGQKPEEGEEDVDKSIVYLTSDSPYTLERLEPYTSYVIGGIVDRNREKGLCYKKAVEHKVRTAKLPIGEYMAMQSRFVLTTNQVVEIMARWLETGDWSEAFLHVIPQRKGAVVKKADGTEAVQGVEDGDAQVAEDAREKAEAEAQQAEAEQEKEEEDDTEPKTITGADEALEATGAFVADEEAVVSQTGGGAVPATQEGSNQ